MSRVFIALLFVLTLAGGADALTKFVDLSQPSGCSGAYDPTRAAGTRCSGTATFTSYATITAGIGGISSGDTLYIRAGTYTEAIGQNTVPSGTSESNRTKIIAYDGAGTVTLQVNCCINSGGVIQTNAAWLEIDGINIDAANASTAVQIEADHIRIKNMNLANTAKGACPDVPAPQICGPGHAISSANIGAVITISGGGFAEVINVVAHDSTTSLVDQGPGNCCQAAHGAYVQTANNTFDNFTVYNVGQNGVQFYHFGDITTSHDNVIKNSLIHDIGLSKPVADSFGVPFAGANCVAANGNQSTIYNMICYNSPSWGVGMGPNTTVLSSTFSNLQYGVTDGGAARTGIVVKNNIFNSISAVPVDTSTSGSGAIHDHNLCDVSGGGCDIVGSPRFVNAPTDFHLLSGSPAIDAGADLLPPYNVDYAGVARPQPAGGLWDIGAFEFGSTPSTVQWVNNRGGSGTATGTANWTANIPLFVGDNTITVTATDASGNVVSDQIIVTYVPSFPGNTLAGAWGEEEGSGTTTADSSGNSNTGTLNGPTWTAGRYGNGLLFDGINDSVDVPDSNSLDLTQSLTLSAWVQPNSPHTDFRAVINKNAQDNNTNLAPPYVLFGQTDGNPAYCPVTGAGSVAVFIRVNGTTDFNICAPPLPIGTRSHIAATYDGSNLRLYVNGVEAAASPVAVTGFIQPTNGTLMIGNSQFAEPWDGMIDEVRVYNWGIPRTAGGNTSPGAACATIGSVQTNIATPSIVGDMNCPVVAPPPGTLVTIKLSSGASPFKVGAGASALKFGSH